MGFEAALTAGSQRSATNVAAAPRNVNRTEVIQGARIGENRPVLASSRPESRFFVEMYTSGGVLPPGGRLWQGPFRTGLKGSR